MVGNNLEKPRVFLKRIEVRETNEDEEVMQLEGAYAAQNDMMCMKSAENRSMKMKKSAGGRLHGSLVKPLFNRISSLNNFL